VCLVMISRETKTRFRWSCALTVSTYLFFCFRTALVFETNMFLILFLSLSVDADEIRRLGKRFRKLDLDNSGALSLDEFLSLPELQQNPLVQRVIDIFDEDGNGEVDFKGNDYVYIDLGITVCA